MPLAAFTLELFPERPAFFLGLLISGSAVGWFVGPAVAGWLLDLTGTWRAAFLVIGSASLVVAFLQWWFWPGGESKVRTGDFFDRVILLPRNLLMLFFLALVLTFQMASEFGFAMWFPVYLRTEILLSATGAGLVAGFFGIGQALGRPVMGFVSDRVGYRLTGLAGSLLMGLSFMLTLSMPSITSENLLYVCGGVYRGGGNGRPLDLHGFGVCFLQRPRSRRHRDLCLLCVITGPDRHRLHRGSLLHCHGSLDRDGSLRLRGRCRRYAHFFS